MEDFFCDDDFTANEVAEINDLEIQATQAINTKQDESGCQTQSSQLSKCSDMLQAEKSLDLWKKETKRSHPQDEFKEGSHSKRMAYEKSLRNDFAKPSTSHAPSQSQRNLEDISSSPFPSRRTFCETPAPAMSVPVIAEETGHSNKRIQHNEGNVHKLIPLKLPKYGRRSTISACIVKLEKQIADMFPIHNGGNSAINSQMPNVNIAPIQKQTPSELGSSRSSTSSTTLQPTVTNFSSLMHILSVLSLSSNGDIQWDARTVAWALNAIEALLDNFVTRTTATVASEVPPQVLTTVANYSHSQLSSHCEKNHSSSIGSSSSITSSSGCANDVVLLGILRLLKLLLDGDQMVCRCIVEESYVSISVPQSPPEREDSKDNIPMEASIAASVNGDNKCEESRCMILRQLLNLMSSCAIKTEAQGIIAVEILATLTNILKSTSATDVIKFKDIWSVPVCTNYCTLIMDGMLFLEYITLLCSMAHCTEIFSSVTFHQDDSCVFLQLASTCLRSRKKLQFESCVQIYHKFLQFLTVCVRGNAQTLQYLYCKGCKCSFWVPKAISKGLSHLIKERKHIVDWDIDKIDKILISSTLQKFVSFMYNLLQYGKSVLWHSFHLTATLANFYMPLRDVCIESQLSYEFKKVYDLLELNLDMR